jgi:hypothetical protein
VSARRCRPAESGRASATSARGQVRVPRTARGVARGLASLLLPLLLAAACGPASASTDSYGELTRFGLPGHDGTDGFLNEEGRTLLLGVDPSDNSAYVLDEPSVETENLLERGKTEVTDTRHFRIQKFTASGGTYSFDASRKFDETTTRPPGRSPFFAESTEADSLAVEGIAVDPGLGRLYVLAVDWRQYERKVDKLSRVGSSSKLRLPVASTLYAFSTAPSSGKLEPAPGTKAAPEKGEGVLAGPTELKAQSDEPGAALLEPSGISVDPATHEVIILAHVDEAGAEADDITSSNDHFVLQRITSKGELAARYTDGKSFGGPDFFAKEASPEGRPHSPVLSGPPEGPLHAFLAYKGTVVQLPSDFASKEAPRRIFAAPPEEKTLEAGINGAREQFAPDHEASPENEGETVGGVLSASPAGTLYAGTKAWVAGPEHGPFGAVLALGGGDGSVLGWIGAQRVRARAERKEPEPYKCVIAPLNYEPIAPVAAGSEGRVFVLALAYLWVVQLEDEENEPPFTEFELYPESFGTPSAPALIEFGPGGGGCPAATSTALAAKIKGSEVTEARAGEAVTFSAALSNGNALEEVDWDFGDGTVETLPTRELPNVEAVHTFTLGGAHTVRATIHTDNLATPTITAETTLTVAEGAALPPRALASGPLTAFVGETVEFDGSASSDPSGPNQIAEYHWSFGDGAQASSALPAVSHVYSSPGAYTVSLTVTNKQGVTSAPDVLPQPVVVVREPPSSGGVEGSSVSRSQGGGGGERRQPPPGSSNVAPDAKLASNSLSVSRAGTVKLRMSCPAGVTLCAGTVKLRSIGAASARHGVAVTLASGRFAIPGGGVRAVSLRLTAHAHVLLKHRHKLAALAVIHTHDPTGAQYLRQTVVTLRSGNVRAPARR